ncbi:deoxyguanosinetriphosphate triphosphohydrolase [Eubacterium pyruvativorans]|uniref:deoxyguanosinetriphosphate triphosphohydrolase n=1 Tax=Eubacterium pyruvativorans TaxID=155865 RepID=UPI0013D8C620|nr:deoxyguanosinetriphosphate triphosphohydrolase [Eubacterium pyruvativorans]
MLLRENLEQREKEWLRPEASKAAESRGRREREEECPYRTVFQRDRDRIIHSKAFRRLMHKTQVFLSPEGDHYRTRLIHTLEVSQVARTLARALNLNEDLTEAIALGHDLGHTPFGHNGEMILNRIHPGGFRHNEQSLRVVDRLESHRGKQGMNLTFEVRDGILNHPGDRKPATLEGQIVKISDRIAYINHDIDDAVRSGVITEADLPPEPVRLFGSGHGERIDSMISAVIRNSDGKPFVRMDEEHMAEMDRLRNYMFRQVYNSPAVKREEDLMKVDTVITSLYDYYLHHPSELPAEYRKLIPEDGLAEAVKDHIAGMTDRFALTTYARLFGPAGPGAQV